jgi:uncharacterized protein YneF (UPF0154 family)
LKQILAILVIVIFILQPASKMYVIVSFFVNQQFIEKNLCEKREVNNNCCHGKCHLKKELAKTEQPSSFPMIPKSTLEIIFNSIFTQFIFTNLDINTTRKTIIPAATLFFLTSFGKGIFHPPQF